MYYGRQEIMISFKSLVIAVLLLFLFDGLVRFLADFLGLYILNAWKDMTILLLLIFALTLIWFILRKLTLTLWDLLFFVMVAYSIPIGILDHGLIQTIWGIKIFFLPVFLYIFIFNLLKGDPENQVIERFIVYLLILAIPIILFGFVQYKTHFLIFKELAPVTLGKISYIKLSWISTSIRAIGTFRNQFEFGNFSAYVVIFSTGMMLKSRKFSNKFLYLFLIFLGFVGIFCSTSRTSMLAAIYGMTGILIVRYLRHSAFQMKSALFLITIALPLLIFFVALFGLGKEGGKLFFLLSTQSTFARLLVWYDALVHFPFFKNPLTFLFGFGVGAIGTAQGHVRPEFYNPVDNLFLYLLINFGFVGLIIFLYLLLAPVTRFLSNIKEYEFGWRDLVAILTLGVIFVEGMYSTVFEGFPLPYLFWFMHFYFRFKT